jgi:hypothetical protein
MGRVEGLSKAEVNQFGIELRVDDDVLSLDVPVSDFETVQIFDGIDDLVQNFGSVHLLDGPVVYQVLEQLLPSDEFHEDVYFGVGPDCLVYFCNVGVSELAVNGDLSLEMA